MKMLPERTAPREIFKLSIRALIVGVLLALVCSFVLPMPFVISFVLITTIVFLDGFIEATKWKRRLIIMGICVSVFILTNYAAWPILKERLAARYPEFSRSLVRSQSAIDLFLAKRADAPAIEAKKILFEELKNKEQKVLTVEVTKLAAAGDAEGAAELIRQHQERLAKIEATLNPKAPATNNGPGILDKTKNWFTSKEPTTKIIPPLTGQDVHLSLKAGDQTNTVRIPLGMFYDFRSTKASSYKFIINGSEYMKGDNIPEFVTFKLVAITDSDIDIIRKNS